MSERQYRVLAVATHSQHDLVAPVAPEFIFPCVDVDPLACIVTDALSDRMRLQSIRDAALTHIDTCSPDRNTAAIPERQR